MPSLFNVSESDPTETSETKKCGDIDILLNADTDIGATSGRQLQTDDSDFRHSESECTKDFNAIQPSTAEGEGGSIHVNTKDSEETDEALSLSAPSPHSKKRRVTPTGDSGLKKKQQKKVNQMSLSSFFFQRSENVTTTSTLSKMVQETAERGNSDAVMARVSSPRKVNSSFNDSSSITTSDNDTPNRSEIHKLDMVTDQFRNAMSSKIKSDENEVSTKISPSFESETGNAPSTETILYHENGNSPNDALAFSLESEIKPDSGSTNTTSIDLTESAFETKNPQERAQSAPSTPSIRTKNRNNKRSSARKGKKSESTKNLKSSESLDILTKKKLSEEDLSKERYELLQKYRKMKTRYLERASDITYRHKDGLDEEDFGTVKLLPMSEDIKLKVNDSNICEEFPTEVVANMGLLIEGR